MNYLGVNIDLWIDYFGYNYAKISKDTGISRGMINGYVRTNKNATPKTLVKLGEYFGVKPHSLLKEKKLLPKDYANFYDPSVDYNIPTTSTQTNQALNEPMVDYGKRMQQLRNDKKVEAIANNASYYKLYRFVAKAGQGVINFNSNDNMEFIPKSFVKLPNGYDKLIMLEGDSMHPTYSDRSILFLKPSNAFFLKIGKVYLFLAKDNSGVLKRLKSINEETITLTSDNTIYKEIEYDKIDLFAIYEVSKKYFKLTVSEG